ncbi:MAG: amidase [Armatimonadota bacterium]|nr:amidase [Armatimonadota bacterium]
MTTAVEVCFRFLTEIAALYRRGELSPTELTRMFLDRIDRLDRSLHAFITVAAERALEDAAKADCRLARGDPGLLIGIPIAVKDNIATAGLRTTCNCRVLEDWVPHQDAAVIQRLRSAGAVIIGKTNLNEFGWSLPTLDDLCPPPRNPFNREYAAVGSSSGSAVAVSAGMATAALGTDGGGSVRLPAGQMGLVGFNATHGLVSRIGVLHAGSIGDVGPLARTVADAAALLQVLATYDPDARPRAYSDYLGLLGGSVRGMRVGVPRSYLDAVPVETEVSAAFDLALSELARLGATVTTVELPTLGYVRAANFVVLNAEHYAAHEAVLRLQWARYGRSARLYLAQGAFLTAADYLRAREVGRLARLAIDEVLQHVDVLAMPTSPVVTAEAARRPDAHRWGIGASFTSPFNLTGHPALSIPCGMSALDLPVGLHLVGRHYDEATLLRVAHAYEQATAWHTVCRPDRVIAR